MSEMIERVSRAVFPNEWLALDRGDIWKHVVDDVRADLLNRGRAAIEAMREPDMSMLHAALEMNRAMPEPRPLRVTNEYHDAGLVFGVMIDAALQAEVSRPQSAQLGPGMIPQPPEPSQ
jgi:hypothetical protein